MDPLKLTADQLAALERAFPEVPCVGPDGAPAGYWLEAAHFRELRRLAYVEVERHREARDAEAPGPSVWGDDGPPNWVRECRSPAEVLERLAERADRGDERREAA